MVFFFPQEVKTVVQAIRAGRSAGVSGSSGVGVTALLERVTSVLEGDGFLVVVVRGRPTLPRTELLALHQAGIDLPPGVPRSLSALIDRLAGELTSHSLRAIVLDDVESIDTTTLGIVQVAAERTGTPIVHARHAGLLTLLRDGVRLTHFAPVQVVLNPLDFASVSTLLEARLGAPADVEVVSRVYGRSGGITGLALAIVDGALDAGILYQNGSAWSMHGPTLWTPTVTAWLEAKMSTLAPEEYDALRHLALAHATPEQGTCTRLDEAQLSALESRGTLSVTRHQQGTRYTLFPPALGLELRRTAGGALRLALDQHPEPSNGPRPDTGRDVASFVTQVRDRLDARLLAVKAAWERAGTVASAIPYLISLLQSPRTDRTVASVFDGTDPETATSAEQLFDFVFLRELWRSSRNSDDLSAPAGFADLLDRFPDWADAVATMAAASGDGGSRSPSPTAGSIALDVPGGAVIAASHAYNCLALGRISQARAWNALIPDTEMLAVNRFQGLVSALADSAAGETERALTASTDGIASAIDGGDVGGVMLHSYAGALILLRAGRWRAALGTVERALAFGPSGPIDSGVYRALLHLAAIVDIRLGQLKAARLYHEQAQAVSSADQALPAMQEAFGDAVERLLHEDPIGATARLRSLAEQLLARNNVFAATVSVVLALVLHPEPETLVLYASALRLRGEHQYILDILVASFERPETLRALVDRLPPEHEDLPLAALALDARARQEGVTESGIAIATVSDALRARMVAHHPEEAGPGQEESGGIDPGLLSTREKEVVRLARGNSNAAIAATLDLSVRTVESHIHNALKKTGTASRRELVELIGDALS